MKKSFQRPVGRILGLKSKTFILSFLSQIIPDSQITTFMLACCTATRVAAHGARHGAGRLLADQHDGTIHLAVHLDDLPELRLHCRAPEEHADSESIQQQ